VTDLEKLLVTALRNAWAELNAIRARDGVPYHHDDGMPYVDSRYFSTVVEECAVAIEAATGDMPKPWAFSWELNSADSSAFINALLTPREPNEALRRAAQLYQGRRQ
jgi:Protein of unknown function (DUF1778)